MNILLIGILVVAIWLATYLKLSLKTWLIVIFLLAILPETRTIVLPILIAIVTFQTYIKYKAEMRKRNIPSVLNPSNHWL